MVSKLSKISPVPMYLPGNNLAGLHDERSGIKVWTLLQNPGEKRPSISAYLGARYSRSADSIVTISQETNAADAPARLEKIFHGYGHASVAGMAHVFVCIEDIPVVTAMRFFNLCPCQDGQERSSRYQDFSKGSFFRSYPTELPHTLRVRFEELMQEQLKFYAQANQPIYRDLALFFDIDPRDKAQANLLKSRTFDVTRHLLPIGMNTSFCAVMSAREWSRYIALMRGSSQRVENVLGELLYQLLTGTEELKGLGYVPEADTLIRHAEPEPTVEYIVNLLAKLADDYIPMGDKHSRLVVDWVTGSLSLAKHAAMLTRPFERPNINHLMALSEQFRFLFNFYNRHRLLGPIAQTGTINLRGVADLGTIKDLNRHRSLERWVPFLDNAYNIRADIAFNLTNRKYGHCLYINEEFFSQIRQSFNNHYDNLYQKIDNWSEEASNYLSNPQVLEWVRYLLPHSHLAEYSFYGSMDDLVYTIDTRVRPGGHANYRMLMKDWWEHLGRLDPLYKGLVQNSVNVCDRGQFIDRT